MATHRSAIKRQKQSEKRRFRNVAFKSTIKSSEKKIKAAIGDNNAKEAGTHLAATTSLLDKAVTKGVLHRNTASRKISRLTTAVNSIPTK